MTQTNVYPKNKEPYQVVQNNVFRQLQLQLWDALDNPDRTYIDMFAIHLYTQLVNEESYWEEEAKRAYHYKDDLQDEINSLEDELRNEQTERERL